MSGRDPGAGRRRPDRRPPPTGRDRTAARACSVGRPVHSNPRPGSRVRTRLPHRARAAQRQDPPAYRGRPTGSRNGTTSRPTARARRHGPANRRRRAAALPAGRVAAHARHRPAPGPPRRRAGSGVTPPGGGWGGTGRRPAGRDPWGGRSPRDERSGRAGGWLAMRRRRGPAAGCGWAPAPWSASPAWRASCWAWRCCRGSSPMGVRPRSPTSGQRASPSPAPTKRCWPHRRRRPAGPAGQAARAPRWCRGGLPVTSPARQCSPPRGTPRGEAARSGHLGHRLG